MSDQTQQTNAINQSAAEQTSASAGATPTKPTAGDQANMNTTINSMSDLKEKSPKVYDAMMIGIATTICNRMKHAQERIKEKMREGRNNA